jgi:hypothetical protein
MLQIPVAMLTLSGMVGFASDRPASIDAQAETACIIMNQRNFDSRPSPLDSISFSVSGQDVKVCYGRPSARGRTMIGGENVPFGQLWRTGANEPTMIHTPVALSVAGIEIEPGTYSLYTVPGETEWEVVVNRSTSQWGAERGYTEEIEAQEIGRGRVVSGPLDAHVETFTIKAEPVTSGVHVILEWEGTRVAIPVRAR